MKTMKTILFAVALLIGVNAYAQDGKAEFGVKAGLNMSNFNGDVEDTKVKIGFNVGVTLDYALTDARDWYLMTGLEYTTKGAKGKKVGDIKPSVNAAYLQLPVHVGYKFDVTEATRLSFHAGPYLAYGVNGKRKFKEGSAELSLDTFDDNAYKRFDFGLGLGAGAEFGKIGVGLGYDFGLLNIADAKDVTIRNGNAYLTVGYKF